MTTPTVFQTWHHSEPDEADQQYDLQLLTICGISVLGRWCGQFGEHYVGWALPLGAQRSQLQPYPTAPHLFDKPSQPQYTN
jgi:hypothetical protein